MNYLLQRRQLLLQAIKNHTIDGFLVTTPVNVTYLTGFSGEDSFYFGSAKNSVLISDSRFEAQIKEECQGLDVNVRGHNKTTFEAAADVLNKSGVKTLGVEENRITLGALER